MSAKRTVNSADAADRKASHQLNGERDTLVMKLIGAASDVGDQPQMRAICAGTIALGIFRSDRKLATTGVRMLAGHTWATWAKSLVKDVIDRTRPDHEQNGYRFELGNSEAHGESSFPSGHSAGIVAVTESVARSYPEHALKARAVAAAVAGAQIPRGTHFIGDVLAGSAIGLAAERLTNRATAKVARSVRMFGHAPFAVALPSSARLRIAPDWRKPRATPRSPT